jgi:putative resolvase
MPGCSIEVVTANPLEDLIAAVVSIVYSFCTRLYGQRRAKQKTEKLVQDLNVKTE